MPLSTQQVRFLRGLTHQLHPLVTVSDKGLSENVLAELEASFAKHELIKVKLRGERAQRKQWVIEIEQLPGVERIHVIGQVACFYRRNSKKPAIALPGNA